MECINETTLLETYYPAILGDNLAPFVGFTTEHLDVYMRHRGRGENKRQAQIKDNRAPMSLEEQHMLIQSIINVPIAIKGPSGKYLENTMGKLWSYPFSPANSQFTSAKVDCASNYFMILPRNSGGYIIKSESNGTNLQVQPFRNIGFINQNESLWEIFDIETDGTKFFFISRYINKPIQEESKVCKVEIQSRGYKQALTVERLDIRYPLTYLIPRRDNNTPN